MAKGKGEAEVVEPQVTETTKETTEPETTQITYTQEQLDTYVQSQLKEQYDKLNATLSAQGAELKRFKESKTQTQPTVPTSNQQMLELMKKKAQDEGDNETLGAIAQIEARTYQEQATQAQQARADDLRRETETERAKLEARIEEAGFKRDNETLDSVWDAFRFAEAVDGKWDVPNKRLDRVLSKTKKPVEKKVEETEEQIRERITREIYEKEGLTEGEKAVPSATPALAGLTRTKIEEMATTKEGLKYLAEHEDEIIKLSFEGKIT